MKHLSTTQKKWLTFLSRFIIGVYGKDIGKYGIYQFNNPSPRVEIYMLNSTPYMNTYTLRALHNRILDILHTGLYDEYDGNMLNMTGEYFKKRIDKSIIKSISSKNE